MLDEREGLAALALRQAGVAAEDVRGDLLRKVRPGVRATEGQIRLSARAKKLLELAGLEALRLHHPSVATEHLLLALTDLRDGDAIRILVALGSGPEAIRVALSDLMDVPVNHSMVGRVREPAGVRGQIEDWIQVSLGQDVRRLLKITADRVSDSGRRDLEVTDLLLAFTLRPGPALAAGLILSLDDRQAALERDRAWTASASEDSRSPVGPSGSARRQLMAAGAVALQRGSSVVELSDLLLALLDDEAAADLFERIGLDRYSIRNSIRREHALAAADHQGPYE